MTKDWRKMIYKRRKYKRLWRVIIPLSPDFYFTSKAKAKYFVKTRLSKRNKKQAKIVQVRNGLEEKYLTLEKGKPTFTVMLPKEEWEKD